MTEECPLKALSNRVLENGDFAADQRNHTHAAMILIIGKAGNHGLIESVETQTMERWQKVVDFYWKIEHEVRMCEGGREMAPLTAAGFATVMALNEMMEEDDDGAD